MTLLDAPVYDEARDRRRRVVLLSAGGPFWSVCGLVAGGWPPGGLAVELEQPSREEWQLNHFLTAVEKNDLPKAYGIWIHDKNWQQHPAQNGPYTFDRFQGDWSSQSPDNEYGVIKSHQIVAARMYGNVLLMAALVNGRKSKALNIDYDPNTHTLNFSPPGVELLLEP